MGSLLIVFKVVTIIFLLLNIYHNSLLGNIISVKETTDAFPIFMCFIEILKQKFRCNMC